MNRDPKELKIHPALREFPMLTGEQFEALKQSVRDQGILEPVRINRADQVIDGRNRLKAALELGLEDVPVAVLECADPVKYAIETAITGRQLSKTGVCLLLLENHPDLACERKKREKQGKRNPVSEKQGSHAGDESFVVFSVQYQVPRYYFSLVSKCLDLCRNEHDERRLRVMVYEMEVSAKNLEKALLGWQRTHPIDEEPGEDDLHNEPPPRRAPVNLSAGFRKAIVWFREQGAQWSKLGDRERQNLRDMWIDAIKNMPAELKRLVK